MCALGRGGQLRDVAARGIHPVGDDQGDVRRCGQERHERSGRVIQQVDVIDHQRQSTIPGPLTERRRHVVEQPCAIRGRPELSSDQIRERPERDPPGGGGGRDPLRRAVHLAEHVTDEVGLADPRLAVHDHHVDAVGQGSVEASRFSFAADQDGHATDEAR